MKPDSRSKAAAAEFDNLIKWNVETITRIEQAVHNSRSKADVVSDAIAGFCGSTLFVYVHIVVFAAWLALNTMAILPKSARFDPPPFNMLTLVVSLEAIFLSTFILISQNRQQRAADQRNHLDLQINMLAEQESSQMLVMMRQMMDHLGIGEVPVETQALELATDHERLAEEIQENLNVEEPKEN